MSDGGNLKHFTIYGKTEVIEVEGQTEYIGVGDQHHYSTGIPAERMRYDLNDGTPYPRPYEGDNWAEKEKIPVISGLGYYVSALTVSEEPVAGILQVLFYDKNDNYVGYQAASSNVESLFFTVPSTATQCMPQMYYPEEITKFDIYNITVPIVLSQFEDKTTYIPIGRPLYDGMVWELTGNIGLEIETWSGENTLTIPTRVIPRVKLTYKEPTNISFDRIIRGVVPITINATGTNLMNWVIYGAEGGVSGTADIFTGGVDAKFYNPSTGEYVPQMTGFYSSNSLIPVTEGVTYECIGVWETAGVMTGYQVLYYDSNDDFLSSESGGGAGMTFTVPTGAAKVRLQVNAQSNVLTNFILNAPALPVTVTQGTNSQTVVIPITAPLTENQSVSMESTGISIPTYNGQTTISVVSEVQPTMKIQYIEKRS